MAEPHRTAEHGGDSSPSGEPRVDIEGEAASLRARLQVLELQASRLRDLSDGTPVPMWATDARGRLEFVNRAYREFFGVGEDELRSGDWRILVHPDDVAAYNAAFTRALEDRSPFHATARVRMASGEWRCIESVGAPRYSASGEYVGMAGSSPDVTDRVAALQELRASEHRYRHLVEYTSDLVFHVGLRQPLPLALPPDQQVEWVFREGYFVAVNDSFARAYGYEHANELEGRPLTDVVPRSPLNLAFERTVVANGHRIFDAVTEEVDRHGGRKLLLNSMVGRIEDGHVLDYVGTSRDVTEQHRIERDRVFLDNLSRAYAPLASAETIADLSSKAIREHFGVTRVNFSDVDLANRIVTVFAGEREAGLKDDHIAHPLEAYLSSSMIEDLAAGRPVAVNGVATDARLGDRAAAYAQWNIGSLLLAPHRTDGRWSFMVALHRPEPYAWRVEELDLLREVVGRVHLRIERARAEEALRDSEARLQLAMIAGRAGTWDLDLVTGHNIWSESLFLLMGCEPTPGGRASQDLWQSAVLPEDLPYVLETWRRAEHGRTLFRTEHRVRHGSTGGIAWLRAAGRFFYDDDGRAIRFVGVALDVTDEKRAEEARRQIEARYRTLAANLPGGAAFVVDRDLRFQLVAGEVLATMGMALQQFEGRTVFEALPPEQAEFHAANYRRALAGQPFETEHESNGRYFVARGVPLHGERGEIEGVLAVSFDITARRRAEEALQEADRRKDEFLAMLAHELRNPLAPIRNAAALIRYAAPGNPVLDSARGIIERQLGHLVRLVDDLLDVSRVSRGKITLQCGAVDLGLVARQALETARPQIEAKGHRLEFDAPATPVRVEGDFTRLVQVVGNLLTNAVKFTDPGGVIALSIDRSAATGEARIRIRDNGRGIEPASLPNLFDLFYQAERSLQRAEGGLGIGLSLVRSLVEMHGGRVEARSEGLGHGSEFIVWLPELREGDEPTAGARASIEKAAPRLRVLVVDDNRDVADSCAMLLRVEGHEVEVCYDGADGVRLALERRPDVVLLDLGLPTVDGYSACREMRRGGLDRACIVAVTGYGREEDRLRSLEAGFDSHEIKPMDLSVLRRLMRRCAGVAARGAGGTPTLPGTG